ncbi:DUF3592 domain-containing protein [Yoonia sp. SS1-5]|uniref:DUF3592 domain-containing protein n=1 Tax=Yoonia rhodophyticola TaxID=3137370 RepID=A0AAN0MIP1_9RHOB
MHKLFMIFCVLGLLLGAVWLAWLGIEQAFAAKESRSWPRVDGTVVSAGFETSGSGQTYTRTAFVQYRYTVDGTNFSGGRIAFGPETNFKVDGTITTSRDEAIKSLATQTGGSSVAVYYDPANPSDAVLISGGGGFVFIYLFGSALMLGVALMIFLILTGRVQPTYRR